jgi:membrane-bound lytic murein transglycosylase D
LNKNRQIGFLGTVGFFLVQVAMAAGFQQKTTPKIVFGDTTFVKDSISPKPLIKNDPKQGLTNLFTTAVLGDGVNGAKLNPMAINFVQDYIGRNKKGFLAMKEWAKPYLDLMDDILEQHGLPKELKYLAVIESGLKHNALSYTGAVGPWAFMPAAAKEYGLKMTRGNDERLDYYKSTHAAARLLTDLYQKYGDWLLVIAAYNGGPGNVNKAIKKSGGSKDFWTLQYNLPAESMNHVKKFIGTHYIFEGEGGITTITKRETKDLLVSGSPLDLKEEELNNSTAYLIIGRFNSAVIMKYVEMDKASFDHYNPGFDNKIALEGKYELRLPTQKMNVFVSKRYDILDESIKLLLNSANASAR